MDTERQAFDGIEISDTETISSDDIEISDTEEELSEVIELSDSEQQSSEVKEASNTEIQANDAEPSQLFPTCGGVTEYDDAFLKHLPFIKRKPNIKSILITIHKLIDTLPRSKKCEQCKDKCTFCKYHVDMMNEVVNDEASGNICQATNVVFLVYCIACDQVWISCTELQFQNVTFGFHGYKRCYSEQSHNKRNVRYMMLDQFQSEYSARMAFWENSLGLRRCDMITEPSPELDAWGLHKQYHYMNVSDMMVRLIRDPKADKLSYDSENIVYLIVCDNCHKKYAGKTKKTFKARHPSVLSKHQGKSSVHQHYNSADCTVRDLRWTVLDALSDDQIFFLDKWRYVFNKCELDVKKKIWAILMLDPSLKEFLIEFVWQNEAVEVIKLIAEMDIRKEDYDKILEYWDTVNDDVEITLRRENEKWIKNTKELFIEDREAYWMTALQTRKDGLNVIKSSNSKKCFPNLYNELFKSMGGGEITEMKLNYAYMTSTY